MDHNPVQLRLGFTTPQSPIRLKLGLSGLRVLVGYPDGALALVGSYLNSVAVNVDVNEDAVLTFAVADLHRLRLLPPQVEILARGDLETLWLLTKEPPSADRPLVVSLDGPGRFNLAWNNGQVLLNEPLPTTACSAFMSLEVPFEADPSTWDELLACSRLPVLLGRARVNLDGFVEISTTQNHRVEASPLQALFRLDETHYGMPLAYASDLNSVPGFVWEGTRPLYDKAPALSELPFELSEHAQADLRGLVDRLAERRAEAIVWESGLGRRVFALAAVQTLDAFPLLIVTHPHALWSWQRHLDLLGRSYSLTHDRCDAHIVTYRDLLARPKLPSAASAIFDDLDRAGIEQLRALRGLDGLLDMYRIGCSTQFPDDPQRAIDLMSVLKPAEFRSSASLLARYPLRPQERAVEHVTAYVSRRSGGPAGHGFRRSSVELLPATQDQLWSLEEALDEERDFEESLAEALMIVSAGPSGSLSPKITRTVEIVTEERANGRRVAVLTRHGRTAQLLIAHLRGLGAESTDGPVSSQHADLLVVCSDRAFGDVRSYDHVIVVDYPWSSYALEGSVGAAADPNGPARVTMLHLDCPLDDRAALLAARRRERSSVSDYFAPLNDEEIVYLLSARR